MLNKYILVNGQPVVCRNVVEWMKWFDSADRVVANTKVGRVRVSTVFLGLDHAWGLRQKPVLFETMVFGGPCDGEQWRYATLGAAKRGHELAVQKVKRSRRSK